MKFPLRLRAAMLLALAATFGCDGGSRTPAGARPGSASIAQTTARYRNELFTFAVDNLNRVEECGTGDEMYVEIEPRVEKITAAVQNPASWNPQTDSLAMTWPQPDMLRQVVERLNQWLPDPARRRPIGSSIPWWASCRRRCGSCRHWKMPPPGSSPPTTASCWKKRSG